MKRLIEKDIEAHLVDAVKRAGGEHRKVNWLGRAGAPDRFIMLPGRAPVWVELKAPGKKVEPHQEREHARMRSFGCNVVVIDSIADCETLVFGL